MESPDLAAKLERTFSEIQNERFEGVPVLNSRLSVQAVDFQHFEDGYLGVLVTPWFMNLMVLPLSGVDWPALPAGEKVTRKLPSGSFEFIVGEEPALGHYQMCSLFSPVFEFEDQEAAVATASAVMAEVMRPPSQDTKPQPVRPTLSRRALLRGQLGRQEEHA